MAEHIPDPCSNDDRWLQDLDKTMDTMPVETVAQLRSYVRGIITYLRAKERDRVRRIYEHI